MWKSPWPLKKISMKTKIEFSILKNGAQYHLRNFNQFSSNQLAWLDFWSSKPIVLAKIFNTLPNFHNTICFWIFLQPIRFDNFFQNRIFRFSANFFFGSKLGTNYFCRKAWIIKIYWSINYGRGPFRTTYFRCRIPFLSCLSRFGVWRIGNVGRSDPWFKMFSVPMALLDIS